jgi:hypothetical protein
MRSFLGIWGREKKASRYAYFGLFCLTAQGTGNKTGIAFHRWEKKIFLYKKFRLGQSGIYGKKIIKKLKRFLRPLGTQTVILLRVETNPKTCSTHYLR